MSIVVVAAARTPWGKYQGQLASLSAWQLGQTVIEAAVKRSAIPIEQIHCIFMNEAQKLQQEQENKINLTNVLKKVKYTASKVNEDIPEEESFQAALEFVKSQPRAAAVAGCIASASNNEEISNFSSSIKNENNFEDVDKYVRKSVTKYKKSLSEAVFDSEIVCLKILKQQEKSRIFEEILHDEIFKIGDRHNALEHCDGAAAVVLTSFNNAQELKLSPLAVIEDFEYLQKNVNILPRSLECLEKLFAKVKLQPNQIKHWEIDDSSPQLLDFLEQSFNLNSDSINPHGGSLIMGHSPSTTFIRLLTHITHELKPLEYGCVVSNSYQKSYALIIQKPSHSSATHCLPLVTLYTTNHCPLCDVLLEELELNFSGEYELEKVFIDTKDNLRFLRLYRYDVPVLFLNNQFLCMHRLNHRLLRKQLNLLRNNVL